MEASTQTARDYLEHLQRYDLAKLISQTKFSLAKVNVDHGFHTSQDYVLTLQSPRPFSDALDALPDHDKKRIADAAVSGAVLERGLQVPSSFHSEAAPGQPYLPRRCSLRSWC